MSADRAIGRYRRWYGRLLRLYPRPFRERFAEPMTQTFTDLARERTDAKRSLLAFTAGTFAETSGQILKENMTQLMQTKNYLRWVVAAGLGLVWVNLAVGFMDVENGNLMYVLVLIVALVGAAIGRFEPRETSIAMFATAAAHAVVGIIGLAADLGPTLLADGFWIAGWIASGLLFRQASLEAAPSR